jgi:hypothetical protein
MICWPPTDRPGENEAPAGIMQGGGIPALVDGSFLLLDDAAKHAKPFLLYAGVPRRTARAVGNIGRLQCTGGFLIPTEPPWVWSPIDPKAHLAIRAWTAVVRWAQSPRLSKPSASGREGNPGSATARKPRVSWRRSPSETMA